MAARQRSRSGRSDSKYGNRPLFGASTAPAPTYEDDNDRDASVSADVWGHKTTDSKRNSRTATPQPAPHPTRDNADESIHLNSESPPPPKSKVSTAAPASSAQLNASSSSWPSARRGEYGATSNRTAESKPLSAIEKDAVDAYISHRIKLASNPLANPAPQGTQFSPQLRSLADAVIRKETSLCKIRADNLDDDISTMLQQKEAMRLSLTRFREAITIEEMKIEGTEGFIRTVDDLQFEASKAVRQQELHSSYGRGAQAKAKANGYDEAASPKAAGRTLRNFLSGVGGNRPWDPDEARSPSAPRTQSPEQKTGVAAEGADEMPENEDTSSLLTISPELVKRRALVEDALASSTDHCPTVIYLSIMESLSKIVALRRRVEYEQKWSENLKAELQRLEDQVDSAQTGDDSLQKEKDIAKTALDDAHRMMFMRRKQLIVTHRRLMGVERLPNGKQLAPRDTVEIVDVIRNELAQGSMRTLKRLADTDCAELMEQ